MFTRIERSKAEALAYLEQRHERQGPIVRYSSGRDQLVLVGEEGFAAGGGEGVDWAEGARSAARLGW